MYPSPVEARRKRRPASACEHCRRKKIRCDRKTPCENCTRAKIETCTYSFLEETGVEPQHGWPVCTTGPSQTSGPVLDQSVNLVDVGLHDGQDEHENESSRNGATVVAGKRTTGSLPSGINATGEACQVPLVHASGRKPLRGAFVIDRFFGQSHYLNSVYQFPKVYGCLFALKTDTTGDSHSKYQTCNKLAKSRKDPQPPFRLSDCSQYIPPPNITERLVAAYFRTFESVFRILHEPTFLSQCSDYFAEPGIAGDEFPVTLMLVMAIGIGFCPDIAGWTARSWIESAQAWLGPPTEKNRATIAGVQISCLLLLARQSNNVDSDGVGVSTGSLLQLAMQTGLHIDPRLLPGLSFFDQEIRRRLWATVLEIMIQSAMDSGSLPLLPLDDMDCPCPLNLADEQFSQSTRTSPSPHSRETFTQTSTQVALVKSLPIRLEIARLVNSYQRECPFERALEFSSQLSSHYRATVLCAPPHAASGEMHRLYNFSLRLFELLVLRFLLALHHPFTIRARKDPTFYFSRKVSLEVSLSLLAQVTTSVAAASDEKNYYYHLALIGAGMFSNITGQAAITVCEDLIGQLEEGVTPITSVFSSISHYNLRSIVEEYISLLHARLSINETSIRGYLLFVGLLAQVDAMQSAADIQQEITSALRDALEHCYQILKARSDKSQQPQWQDDMLSMLDDVPSWVESDAMVSEGCLLS
ncbi:fungal-specific transcription factor domain-containing protein [Aspergillus unguis]